MVKLQTQLATAKESKPKPTVTFIFEAILIPIRRPIVQRLEMTQDPVTKLSFDLSLSWSLFKDLKFYSFTKTFILLVKRRFLLQFCVIIFTGRTNRLLNHHHQHHHSNHSHNVISLTESEEVQVNFN